MIKFINLKKIIILLINSNGKNVGSEGKISKRLVITKEKLDIEDRLPLEIKLFFKYFHRIHKKIDKNAGMVVNFSDFIFGLNLIKFIV